jgi:hypothetical protein
VAPSLGIAAAALAVTGVFQLRYSNSARNVLREAVPDAQQGRVTSLFTLLSVGGNPLVAPMLGLLAATAGPTAPLAVGGGASAVAGAVGLLAWVVLRRGPPAAAGRVLRTHAPRLLARGTALVVAGLGVLAGPARPDAAVVLVASGAALWWWLRGGGPRGPTTAGQGPGGLLRGRSDAARAMSAVRTARDAVLATAAARPGAAAAVAVGLQDVVAAVERSRAGATGRSRPRVDAALDRALRRLWKRIALVLVDGATAEPIAVRFALVRLFEVAGADRFTAEQLSIRDGLVAELAQVVADLDAGARAAADGRAGQLLADLDGHLRAAAAAGRHAAWRGGISRGHRWAYWLSMTTGIGTVLYGMYAMTVLSSAVAGIGPGVLFTVTLGGLVVGVAALGPLWEKVSRRALVVMSQVGVVAGMGLYSVVGGWSPGYYLGAFVLGVAGSANGPMVSVLSAWVRRTTAARRALGRPARLADGVVGLSLLGVVLIVAGGLGLAPVLAQVSLPVAAGAGALLGAAAAVGLFLTSPAERWDRIAAPPTRQLVLGPIGGLKHRFVRWVALVYGFIAASIGAFDALKVEALTGIGRADLAPLTSPGFIAGGLVIVALLVPADLANARRVARGEVQRGGLLERRPRLFVALMAGLMGASGLLVAFTQHVIGQPELGIIVAAYVGEAASTGMILGVGAMINAELPEHERGMAENTANFTKAMFQFAMGSGAASSVWAGDAGLPGEWAGVSLLIAAFGVAAVLATGRLLTLRTTAVSRALRVITGRAVLGAVARLAWRLVRRGPPRGGGGGG